MPKRSAADAHLTAAVMPGPVKVEGALKSRSGRTVKPKVWDDGTTAAPLTALKDDAGEPSPSGGGGGGRGGGAHSSDAADPDFSLHAEQQHTLSDSQGRGSGAATARGGGAAQHHRESEEEEACSDGSPRVSLDGSQNGTSLGRARSSSVGRDDHGKFVSGPRPRGTRGGGGSRGVRGEGGGIFKMAAVEVLRLEKRLMSTGEIARAALKRGLIKCTGKTPEATMASALYTDIKRKEGQSIFIRPHEGLFGLREWIEQGVAFQDEFAEEMAKRARVAYGAFVGMPGMPPMMHGMVDSEGVPLPAPYSGMMPYQGAGSLGFPPSMTSPTAAAAAAAKAAAGEDSPDGLMELLSAAEELHKSASEGAERRDVKYAADGTTVPSSPSAYGTAQGQPAVGTEVETAAAAAVDADQLAGGQGPATIAPAASAQGAQPAATGSHSHSHSHSHSVAAVAGAAAAADTSAEESDAAAVLAAVAEAAGEAPSSRRSPSDKEAAALAALQHFPGFAPSDIAAAAGVGPYSVVQPPQQYGYTAGGYYGHPPGAYLYPPAPGLPPLPKQQQRKGGGVGPAAAFTEVDLAAAAAVAEMVAAGSSGSVDLVVRGSNRPFAALAAAAANGGGGAAAAAAVAAAMEAEGQEQVNILNLPLPEVELQSSRLHTPGGAPPAELDPAHLKVAEVQVMRLEKELGTSHPEVGKAYLSLSRLYLAGCEESSSKQLAVAALSRSWEILSVCQLALKKQPSCTSSFTYLMDKIRSAETHRPAAAATAAASAGGLPLGADAPAASGAAGGPLAEQRPSGDPAANGEAAHVAYSPPILAAPRTTAAH